MASLCVCETGGAVESSRAVDARDGRPAPPTVRSASIVHQPSSGARIAEGAGPSCRPPRPIVSPRRAQYGTHSERPVLNCFVEHLAACGLYVTPQEPTPPRSYRGPPRAIGGKFSPDRQQPHRELPGDRENPPRAIGRLLMGGRRVAVSGSPSSYRGEMKSEIPSYM